MRSLNELHCSDDPVFAYQVHVPVSQQGKMHSHARGQLVCATTSVVEVVVGERRWTLQPGHAGWLPGGVGHSVSGDPTGSIFRSLYVRPDLAKRLGEKAAVLDLSPCFQGFCRG